MKTKVLHPTNNNGSLEVTGKLIFAETNQEPNAGELCYIFGAIEPLGIHCGNGKFQVKSGTQTAHKAIRLLPIVIHPGWEEIEVNQWCYNLETKALFLCMNDQHKDNLNKSREAHRALVMPKEFSPAHLVLIIEERLKEKQLVTVQCEANWYPEMFSEHGDSPEVEREFWIKIKNNWADIRPAKKELPQLKEDLTGAAKQLEREVREAYIFLREKNHSIPSETLDFMLNASLEKIKQIN